MKTNLHSFGKLSAKNIISLLDHLCRNNGHTFGMNGNSDGYLVGVTQDSFAPNKITYDQMKTNGIKHLFEFYKQHSALDYPEGATIGAWYDEQEKVFVLDVVVLIKNIWDAVALGNKYNQKEIGIVEGGTYTGSLDVAKYTRIAFNSMKTAGQRSDERRSETVRFTPNKSRFSCDKIDGERPRNLYMDSIFVSPENGEFSFTIWSRAEGHVLGDDNPTYADFMFLGEDNALKLASQIFRSLGYSLLNVLPEGEIA